MKFARVFHALATARDRDDKFAYTHVILHSAMVPDLLQGWSGHLVKTNPFEPWQRNMIDELQGYAGDVLFLGLYAHSGLALFSYWGNRDPEDMGSDMLDGFYENNHSLRATLDGCLELYVAEED